MASSNSELGRVPGSRKSSNVTRRSFSPVDGASGHETRFEAEEVRQAHVTNAPRASNAINSCCVDTCELEVAICW